MFTLRQFFGYGPYPENLNWGKGDRSDVWGCRKRDVVRALLYMDVRKVGCTKVFGAPKSEFALINSPAVMEATASNAMGRLLGAAVCTRRLASPGSGP